MSAIERSGPLHGFELAHLRRGHGLIRHTRRYPWIWMWLCLPRNKQAG